MATISGEPSACRLLLKPTIARTIADQVCAGILSVDAGMVSELFTENEIYACNAYSGVEGGKTAGAQLKAFTYKLLRDGAAVATAEVPGTQKERKVLIAPVLSASSLKAMLVVGGPTAETVLEKMTRREITAALLFNDLPCNKTATDAGLALLLAAEISLRGASKAVEMQTD